MEKSLNQIIYNYISFEFDGFIIAQQQCYNHYVYFVGKGNLVLFKYDLNNHAFLVNKFIYLNSQKMFQPYDVLEIFLLWFNTYTDYENTSIWQSDFGRQFIINGKVRDRDSGMYVN